MMKRLRELEQAQWWPRECIERERNRRLAEVVAISYREVPLYRELFDKARVNPSQIHCPVDLQMLPAVTKAILRDGYPQSTCRKVRGRTYETSTSGSTGRNLYVREDHETAGWYRASFLLALEWAGWQVGQPHVQIGMTTRRNLERRLKDWLLGCHYVSGFDLSNEALDRCLDLVERKRIQHLWGYPGSLFCLARRARQCGWNTPLSSVVTWGDQMHPHYRRMIEEVFKVRVSDTYGCSEGMQIAAQCGQGSHYHLHELDVILELLDEHGNPVAPGAPGRVVLTRLHAGPMPFIRYDVGDIAVGAEDERCTCGRSFKLLSSINGRSADCIITPSGNRLIVHFFTGIIEYFHQVDSFQVVQERCDKMDLYIIPRPTYDGETERQLLKALRDKGADLDIQVRLVKDIPLTPGGKRRFVVSMIQNELCN